MNYIYDVLTNFNENYIDFYEWEKKDNILHFKKIPIIKINKNDYNTILTNEIEIEETIINKIKNKAEVWNNRLKEKNNYLLITNGTDIFGIQFDNNGKSIKRSSLLVDEELDIINNIRKNENISITYNIIQKKEYILETRTQIEKQKYILKELNNLENNNKIINYLYYECFNKEETNNILAKNHLIKSVKNTNICNKLYNFLKLIKTSNN